MALLLPPSSGLVAEKVTFTENITEWDYGNYEGLKYPEIRLLRKEKGLDTDKEWNIWSDGCEGGEYTEPWSGRFRQADANTLKINATSYRAVGQAYLADQKYPETPYA